MKWFCAAGRKGPGSGLIAAILVCLTIGAEAQELRLAASPWSPYVDQRLYQSGVAAALATAALERAGYDSTLTIGSWPEVMVDTQEGAYDVLVGVWFTEERAEALAFSEPFLDNEIKFLKRADSEIRFRGIEDLAGLRIGVVSDYAYNREAVDTTGIEIATAGSVRENVESLLADELDLVLADARVVMYEVNQLVVARRVTLLPEAVITRGLRIAVSRARADHEEIIEAFEAAVAAMRSDGSYNQLLANYRISL